MKRTELLKELENKKIRSAWNKGVKQFAIEMVESLDHDVPKLEDIETTLLDGAKDWSQYSWGGCGYIYDEDIATALCNHSELIRTDYGRLAPNKYEEWLDVQARALNQAYILIYRTVRNYEREIVK